MSISVSELLPMVGKVLRIKIISRTSPTQPFIEYPAKLERVFPDQGKVSIFIGYTTLTIDIADIESIEGGLQDLDDPRNSMGF